MTALIDQLRTAIGDLATAEFEAGRRFDHDREPDKTRAANQTATDALTHANALVETIAAELGRRPTDPSPYTDHLATARGAADNYKPTPASLYADDLAHGQLHATLALVEATREQTEVFRQLLAEDIAEADRLRRDTEQRDTDSTDAEAKLAEMRAATTAP